MTLDELYRAIVADIRATTTLDGLRAVNERIDAGRATGFSAQVCGRLHGEVARAEMRIMGALDVDVLQ